MMKNGLVDRNQSVTEPETACTNFFKWANPGLFRLCFRSFQTNNTIFTTNQFEKMSIQYMAPGLEPTTSQT